MVESKLTRARAGRYFRPDIYRRLLPYFAPYRIHMCAVLAIAVVQSGLALVLPWPMKMLIDNGLNGQPLPTWFVHWFPFALPSRLSILVFAAAAGVAIKLLDYPLGIANSYLGSRINGGVNLRFAADL